MAQCDCREGWHSLIVERDGSFIVTVVCHDVRWHVMVSVMTFLHREGGLSWQWVCCCPRFSIDRHSDPRRHFSIHPETGKVTLRKPLDRETQERHIVIIRAIDKGQCFADHYRSPVPHIWISYMKPPDQTEKVVWLCSDTSHFGVFFVSNIIQK